MGQFMPSSLIPSTLTETYSVDATQALQFSCQINGTSPTTQYRLQIMQNNSSSTLVYDTNVVTLSTPLYPVDYNGNPNELVVTIPANTMQNNNNYKWTITSYWSGGSIQSYENVFYTYATPTLTIGSVPGTLAQNSFTFTATYSQAQNVGVEKFGWILENTTTQEILIDTISNNNIYSSDIQLYYDGFFTNNTYRVKCQCWASNGVIVATDYTTFNVSYTVETLTGTFTAEQRDDSGILLNWPKLFSITGTYSPGTGAPQSPKYSFNETVQSNTVTLNYGNQTGNVSYITFNQVNSSQMSFPLNSSHIISFNWNDYNAINNPIYAYMLNGGYTEYIQIYLNANKNFSIQYVKDSSTIVNQEIYQPTRGETWYIFQIVPNETTGFLDVCIYTYGVNNGLFPDTTLYPSQFLYPRAPVGTGEIAKNVVQTSIPVNKESIISQVVLYSPSTINYLQVKSGTLSNEEIQQNNIITYEPSWDSETELLATFDNNLNAGNITSFGQLVKWSIYRNSNASPQLIHIVDTEPLGYSVVDYTACNQNTYNYYVYPVFDNGIGIPIQSNSVDTNWWSWILLVCSESSTDKLYNMDESFIFDLDVSSGTLSNNTTFSVLENFTPYAKIQNSNSSYWTGSISALLGNSLNCTNYSDTVQQMNQIKSLSSDTRMKVLKDRKGNMWMVRVNAPISEQIHDEYVEQAVNITINWMEIGSMDGISVTAFEQTG